MVSLLNIWRSQWELSPNLKGLLWGLIMWYAPSSWWLRVPCLRNIHDAWWIPWSLDPPSSPPEICALQAPGPPPSPYAICSSPFTWWGRMGAASGRFLMLWNHVRFGGTRFVELCFVNFCNFLQFCGVGSGPLQIIRNLLILLMKPGKIAWVPLLMKNMMGKHQVLTHMFNVRYVCLCNQQISL